MLFITIEDFIEKAKEYKRLSKEEEAELFKIGGTAALEKIKESYYPYIASQLKTLPDDLQSLATLNYLLIYLEKAVSSFKGGECINHLSRYLREAKVKAIVYKGEALPLYKPEE